MDFKFYISTQLYRNYKPQKNNFISTNPVIGTNNLDYYYYY